ncbi:hypothetical protein B0H10DRAFT_2429630 [Mycena sp. CBHHK59/15]|nr:hypothetical protein B0H10DRAFT_2429630 [Mycena sp. CBHHK59/15]
MQAQFRDSLAYEEQTAIHQSSESYRLWKIKSPVHGANASGAAMRQVEEESGIRSGVSPAQSITSFLRAAFTSYASRLQTQFSYFRGTSATQSRDQQDTSPPSTPTTSARNHDTAQKLKLQRLMDRRKKEAARAYYNRKVVVTFPGQTEAEIGSATKRKRDEEEEKIRELASSSGFLPLDDESHVDNSHPIPPVSFPGPLISFDSAGPMCNHSHDADDPLLQSIPTCPPLRKRTRLSTSSSDSSDDSSMKQCPVEYKDTASEGGAVTGDCDTNVELEFLNWGDSDTSYLTTHTSPSPEPASPPVGRPVQDDKR